MEALDAYKKLKGGKSEVDCLAFIIHTVARVSEARLMKWSDVDLEKKIWTIQPAADYSQGKNAYKGIKKSVEISRSEAISTQPLRIRAISA